MNNYCSTHPYASPLRGLRENIFQKYFSPQSIEKSDQSGFPSLRLPKSGRLQIRTLVCLIVLGFCGCSTTPALQQLEVKQLKLLPPEEGPGVSLLKQKVMMQSQGLNQQFIAVIRLQQEQLKLVALMPSGQQLFYLEYDGEKLIQKNLSSIDIPDKDILAIMQFALWPLHSIKNHYTKEDGWIVEASPEQRTLLSNAGMLIEVSYQAGTIIVENHLHNYRLLIQPLENIPLERIPLEKTNL